jgi:D-glycero-alpha-D-manno-heptose 1-phosphate guanylyltransferase
MELATTPVVILAGGEGTRLSPAVPDLPKIMAPIARRPFLFWLLRDLERQGARRIVLALGYRAEQVLDYLQGFLPVTLDIATVVEDRPLGTGGALRFAAERQQLAGPLFVLNGDTWIEDGLVQLAATPAARPTMGLVEVADSARYGSVLLENDCIVAFREKGASGPRLVHAGLDLLPSALLARLPQAPASLERDLLEPLAAEGALDGRRLAGRFVDFGQPDDYKAFSEWAERELVSRFA